MKNSFFKKTVSMVLCVVVTLSCLTVGAIAATNDVTVKVNPTKTVYYQGFDWNYSDNKISLVEGIDLTGIKLGYNARTISYTVDEIFGPNIYAKSASGTWVKGDNSIQIFCDDLGSNHYATMKLKFVEISKVEIVKKPNLTTLIMGKHWEKGIFGDVELSSYDLTGLELKITYSDSTTKTITAPNSAVTWSIDTSADYIMPGDGVIYVNYANYSLSVDVKFLEIGDVNGDGKISSLDALMVLENSVNIIELTDSQKLLANVNNDSDINSTDALYILQYVVGLKTSF